MTRQVPYEPLPASVLLGVAGVFTVCLQSSKFREVGLSPLLIVHDGIIEVAQLFICFGKRWVNVDSAEKASFRIL